MTDTDLPAELPVLIDAIHDYAIILIGTDGIVRSWHSGAVRTMGYEAGEIVGSHFSRFYEPDAIAAGQPQADLEKAAREGRAEDEGWRLRKDGARFWASSVMTPMRGPGGEISGFASVTRDLTQRREAEERLRTSEETFRLLVATVKDYAIFLLDPTGKIMTWNAGAERIKGYAPSEIIGKHFSIFYPEADIRSGKPAMELEVAKETGVFEEEGWRLRKDGTRFWANVVITAVHDESGTLRGFAKVTRDLSKRREADEQLRQSEELFRLLVASVKDYAIFMLDPGGHVMTWNIGAERIKGYAPREIIGHHFSEFYTEEDKRDGKPARELEIARESGSVEDEGWRVRKDGTRFWANVIITAVFDARRTLRGFTKVTRDMTDRKRAEEVQRAFMEQREARLQAEEERRRAEATSRVAQEANRAKDEFLMTLSHELRTPLTSILGWARLLPTMQPEDQGFADAVGSINRSAQLQARLIDDVLDVSRIVSGKLRLTVEDVEIEQVLTAAVETVAPSADAKKITIETKLAPQLGSIVADATRLQQVIWNLLTNAVKFTPANGRITLSARRTASHVQIAVSDSGAGIDPSFLPHVFEPFRQAENPRTRVHGGLGLGLSIVRYLVEAHGGTAAAESAGLDQGTTFTVTLPLGALTSSRPEPIAFSALPSVTNLPMKLGGVTILLVDDDEESRRLVYTVLTRSGAQVTAVSSGPEALESIKQRTFDLVITDIAMPHMDGYTLARKIREQLPKQKIVALSAFPAGRAGMADGPFDAYLFKPIEPVELVGAIASAV
jgi:PAS domain S-box-containing protein